MFVLYCFFDSMQAPNGDRPMRPGAIRDPEPCPKGPILRISLRGFDPAPITLSRMLYSTLIAHCRGLRWLRDRQVNVRCEWIRDMIG